MQNTKDNLQYVIACFLTHSAWVKRAKSNPEILFNDFTLPSADLSRMKNFLADNYDKVLTGSLLSEEKRWREFLTTIKYIKKLVSVSYLKNFWNEYLELFSIRDPIPATPLYESVRFLKYLSSRNLEVVLINFVRYELMKNSCAIYNFSGNDVAFNKYDISQRFDNGGNIYIKLNPSFCFEYFEVDIHNLMINLGKVESIKPDHMRYKYLLCFYKHNQTKLVKAIKINEDILSFLISIKNQKNFNLMQGESIINGNMSAQDNLKYLKYFNELGLIFINNIERNE